MSLHLPTTFDGLTIAEASDAEAHKLSPFGYFGYPGPIKLFIMRGSTFEGYVVAGVVVWHEDEGEYDDPSFFSKNNIL
jgi:hypothetical protein